MSNLTSTNSPMRSRPTTKDIGDVDPSIRVDQQQSTVFSSEIFDPGPSTVAPSEATWANQGLGAVIQPVNSQPSETELESKFAQLSKRIDQFSKQLHELNANFKLVNARLDSLESQAVSTPTAEPAVTVLASQLETRFESLENIFKTQCEMANLFFANARTQSSEVEVKANTDAVVETESTLETTVSGAGAGAGAGAPTAHWQEQKQAMMAKYGFDSETTEPDVATNAEPVSDQPVVDTPITDYSLAVTEEATDAVEEQAVVTEESNVAAEEQANTTEEASVDELKAQLNSKIREAEVEMSINRARLMQERVEFERAQAELERRAAKLEAKLAASTGGDNGDADDENSSIMGRFKRHLGN